MENRCAGGLQRIADQCSRSPLLTTGWVVDWSTVGPALRRAARRRRTGRPRRSTRSTPRRPAGGCFATRATSQNCRRARGRCCSTTTARAATQTTAQGRRRHDGRAARRGGVAPRLHPRLHGGGAVRAALVVVAAARHGRRALAPAGQCDERDRQPLLRAVRPDAAGLRPARHRLCARGRGDAETGAGAVRHDAALRPRLLDGRVLRSYSAQCLHETEGASLTARGASPAAG